MYCTNLDDVAGWWQDLKNNDMQEPYDITSE